MCVCVCMFKQIINYYNTKYYTKKKKKKIIAT